MKSLSQQICKLVLSRNKHSFKNSYSKLFPNKTTINLNIKKKNPLSKCLAGDEPRRVTGRPAFNSRASMAGNGTRPDLMENQLQVPVGGDRILVEESMHLTSLEVEDFKDVKSGYSISFNFSENPFFEDRKLTKTYTFLDEGTKITATLITWKEGMGIPNGVTHEKKGKKRPPTDESIKCLGLYFFFYFSICKHQFGKDTIKAGIDLSDWVTKILSKRPLRIIHRMTKVYLRRILHQPSLTKCHLVLWIISFTENP
ncbi:hypothetical protein UlMin_005728 [Ulmus minor]